MVEVSKELGVQGSNPLQENVKIVETFLSLHLHSHRTLLVPSDLLHMLM